MPCYLNLLYDVLIIVTLDLDFGYMFLKFRKGTVIVLRPKMAVPDRIIRLMERFFDTIKEKEGLIVVKPGKIRVLK